MRPMNSETFNQVRVIAIPDDVAGQRVDNYLLARLKGVPKSRIYKMLRKGEVRANKKRIKPDYRLQAGDQLRIPPVRTSTEKAPVSTGLEQVSRLEHCILHETDRLLVLNKPPMMAVHGGSGLSFGVIEALRALRPGAPYLELVHRLDRATSGCLLIAKKRSCLRLLHRQLETKTMRKRYLALVVGDWPTHLKKVSAPLRKQEAGAGERLVGVDDAGKASLTRFEVVRRFDGYTLVAAEPVTGRTHQIRVHAASSGHPLVGDDKYGDTSVNSRFFGRQQPRLFLHAEQLRFREREEGDELTVEAPLPGDLDAILAKLQPIPE